MARAGEIAKIAAVGAFGHFVRSQRRNAVYVAQAIAAVVLCCAPMLVEGMMFRETVRHSGRFFAWTSIFISVLWLRLRLPVWLLLPGVLAGGIYCGYITVMASDIGYNQIASVINTNAREAGEFVTSGRVLVPLIGVLVAFAAMSWVLCSRRLRKRVERDVRIPNLLLYGLMAVAIFGYWRTGSEWSKTHIYPVKIFWEGRQYLREVRRAQETYANLKYSYEGPPADKTHDRFTVVLILGESARAANWSLYGYDRQTTPRLQELFDASPQRAVLFTDALSSGRLTMNAVPSMLSPRPAGDFPNYCKTPSVIRVFRKAGYATSAISSQDRDSFWSGPPMMMLGDADSLTYCDNDGQMIGEFDRWLADSPARRLIVLHTFGSHHQYSSRYPDEYDIFHGRGSWVDTYDNSIAYSDYVISEILKRIDRLDSPAIVLFASDHGENLDDFGDGNLMHSCREYTRYEIEVPMFFYANEAFAAKFPEMTARAVSLADAPVGHDNLSQSMLGAAGLTDPQVYEADYDIFSGEFRPHERYFVESFSRQVTETEVRATPHGRRSEKPYVRVVKTRLQDEGSDIGG